MFKRYKLKRRTEKKALNAFLATVVPPNYSLAYGKALKWRVHYEYKFNTKTGELEQCRVFGLYWIAHFDQYSTRKYLTDNGVYGSEYSESQLRGPWVFGK